MHQLKGVIVENTFDFTVVLAFVSQSLTVHCLRLLRRYIELVNELTSDPAAEWTDWSVYEQACVML